MPDKPKYSGPERRQQYRVINEVKILIRVGSTFSQVGIGQEPDSQRNLL